VSASFCFGQGTLGDRDEAGGAAQRRKQRGIGAGDPGLAVEPGQHLDQRGAARCIEMRGDLVEQEERRLAAHRALQPGLGEDDRNQQRLLLAGRRRLGGNALLGMVDPEIGAVWPEPGAAGRRVAGAAVFESRPEALLDGQRRGGFEPALERADKGQASARKRVLALCADPVEPLDRIAPRRRSTTPIPI